MLKGLIYVYKCIIYSRQPSFCRAINLCINCAFSYFFYYLCTRLLAGDFLPMDTLGYINEKQNNYD